MTHIAAQARLVRVCAVFVLVSCSGTGDDSATEIPDAVPAITEATATCESGEARWSFSVTTDAWTGNGQVVLSVDGEYVEKHTMYSTSAAADGTRDELALELSVVPDWRDVTLGSSTAFNCGEAALTGILRVWKRDGSGEADCRAFGESPERWAEWDAGVSCEAVLDE